MLSQVFVCPQVVLPMEGGRDLPLEGISIWREEDLPLEGGEGLPLEGGSAFGGRGLLLEEVCVEGVLHGDRSPRDNVCQFHFHILTQCVIVTILGNLNRLVVSK